MLDSTLARREGGELELHLAYLASREPSAARAADTPPRAAAMAAALLDLLAPMLPGGVAIVEVDAVFGAGAAWGATVPVRFVPREGRWNGGDAGAPRAALVPPLPTTLARSAEDEEAAVAAARAFLERADEGDYEATWDLTSAVVKATTSRPAFEASLREANPPRPVPRRERFLQYEARGTELRLGDVLHVCFDQPGGAEVVELRRDDDQQWRVSSLARLESPTPSQ